METMSPLSAGAWVVPGEALAPLDAAAKAGPGTYEVHGQIHASLAGVLDRSEDPPGSFTYQVKSRFGGGGSTAPYVGAVVTGRVELMSARFARVSILALHSTVLPHPLSGEIKREEAVERQKEGVDLGTCFRPGDVVVCRVVSAGETAATFALSTAEEELGVVEARCPEEGSALRRTAASALVCGECGLAAKRKLARLPDLAPKTH